VTDFKSKRGYNTLVKKLSNNGIGYAIEYAKAPKERLLVSGRKDQILKVLELI